MNDLLITVSGWVATEPRFLAGPSGARMTSFRLASTSRYFDRDKGEWVDGRTEWFTVRVFRAAAVTVADSIAKGQPVVVHGRLKTTTWESEQGPRVDLVIDATSVGHDLTRGIAKFQRATGTTELPPEAFPSGVAIATGGEDLPPTVAEAADADTPESAVVAGASVLKDHGGEPVEDGVGPVEDGAEAVEDGEASAVELELEPASA